LELSEVEKNSLYMKKKRVFDKIFLENYGRIFLEKVLKKKLFEGTS